MRIRFELEARAGLKLNHPNLVRTLRLDHTDDIYYLAMEFFPGVTLQEMVARGGPVAWPAAVSIVAQAAAGLAHLHAQGMIHRDVKPANLLVDHSGHTKLIDFGLALLTGEELELSLAEIFGQQLVGTADYVAPEQSLNSFAVDARADIFSLGATLYFALSGAIPFPAQTRAERLRSRHLQPARPLREIVPAVPPVVAAIVERMMAKEPTSRFATADEVAAALAPFGQREPVAFDYAEVLRARLNHVRQRTAAARDAQGLLATSAGSSSVGSSAGGSSADGSTGTRETPAPSAAPRAPASKPSAAASPPAPAAAPSAPDKTVSSAPAAAPGSTDPDLKQIAAVWPTLTAHARRVVLALIQADRDARR
jgi:serine/threonine-protein kinase